MICFLWDSEKPSFSLTTLSNLKQNPVIGTLETGMDNATQYIFDQQFDYVTSTAGKGTLYVSLGLSDVLHEIGITDISRSLNNMAFDSLNNKLYITSINELWTVDPATGEKLTSVLLPVVPNDIEMVNGIMYGISGHNLMTFNPTTGTNTIIGVLSGGFIQSLAYVGASEQVMYGIQDNSPGTIDLISINLSTASVTTIDNNLSDVGPLWYRLNNSGLAGVVGDRLYYNDSNDIQDLHRITDRTSQQITDTIVFDGAVDVSTSRTANENWWNSNPDRLRFGNFTGLSSDVYLRFPVDIPAGTTVGSANITFTAHDTEVSVGDTVNLRLSVLDPGEISTSTNLSLPTVTFVATLGAVEWSPSIWTVSESDIYTTVDITTLIQSFILANGYTQGRNAIIKIQTLNTTSQGHHRTVFSFNDPSKAPVLDMTYVIDTAEINSDPGGFQSEKSYKFAFEFEDNASTRWVQIRSFNTPIKPNPILDLSKRLRFRILIEGGSVYLTLGIREITRTDATVGDDGGTIGPIEWVGADQLETDNLGNVAPIGILIKESSEWQEIDIDLQKANIVSFENGNNSLETGFGVLEHLAFTINPISSNPTGPFIIFIDKLEQLSDLLVSGTSQGILISNDFGSNWELSRFTDTPVHKFFKAKNNRFIWAISATEVLLSIDPAFWFVASGIEGVQYIRDITEDNEGNIFISTDKGVYWLEISLITTFSVFRQTQPINAFSTDAYALYHNAVASGIDEIWVSTELGLYKTEDKGNTWEDTGLRTGGLVSFEIINIGNDTLISITRKHVLRKQRNGVFQVIADFEQQHDIFDIWTMAFFSGRLYISTGHGVFSNDIDELFNSEVSTITFEKVFEGLNINTFIRIAFGLDVISLGPLGEKLFIGQENRLVQSNENNILSVKKEFRNKELPSFFIDDVETTIGYIYNTFNNSISFREPILANKIVSAAHLPRRSFFAREGGWSQTNPDAEIFIFKNGIPTWLDFIFDESDILGKTQILDGKLRAAPTLTEFNSFLPDSQTFLDASLSDILTIQKGGQDEAPLINDTTIVQFMDDYTRFLSLVTKDYANQSHLDFIPISLIGIPRSQRIATSRANILEAKEDFEAENSTGINIDIVAGEVSFLSAFSQATNPVDKDKLSFSKFDNLEITVFNANVINTGEFTHKELEDKMESINTGLSSNLGRSKFTNLIKLGIFNETQHNFFFDRFNVHNIQSRYYAAHTSDWYDVLNSTLDWDVIIETANTTEVRFATAVAFLNEDPYFLQRIWIGTDDAILQYQFNNDEVELENLLLPFDPIFAFVWDIYSPDGSEIYVVTADKDTGKGRIMLTLDFGITWTELESVNLPSQIFTFRIINGVKVVTTNEGVFYSDNEFGTWLPSVVVPSDNIPPDNPSLTAFKNRTMNIFQDTFLILESDRWFYTSGSGIEFFSLGGQLVQNNVSVINKIIRFKNITWAATDQGLYNDGNSILADAVNWTLELEMESSATASAALKINDLTHGTDALYACTSEGKIYRFLDANINDTIPNEWKSYFVPNFGSIHKIVLFEQSDSLHTLVVISYNKVRVIDVTPGTGVFN